MNLRRTIATRLIEEAKDHLREIAQEADRKRRLAAVERVIDDLFGRYLEELYTTRHLLRHPTLRLDRRMRTDEPEYLDREDFPKARRQRMIQDLDRFNRALLTYPRFLRHIRPTIERLQQKGHHPVRILDLGSGHGAFPIALWRLARDRGMRLSVTGSDISPAYVEVARENARKVGAEVAFIEANAFDLSSFDGETFDIVTCTQSLHHFTPGQLARILCEAVRVTRGAVLFIDGRRTPLFVPGIALATFLITRNRDLVHDGVISIRRMYHGEELRLIAAPATFLRPLSLTVSGIGLTHATLTCEVTSPCAR